MKDRIDSLEERVVALERRFDVLPWDGKLGPKPPTEKELAEQVERISRRIMQEVKFT